MRDITTQLSVKPIRRVPPRLQGAGPAPSPAQASAPATGRDVAPRSALALDARTALETVIRELEALLCPGQDAGLPGGGSESQSSPLLPSSSDDSPLLDEAPPSSSDTPFDPPAGEEGSGKVLILGSLKRPRTVAGYLEVMQQRGITLPFDPTTLPAEVRDQMIPGGTSVIFSEAGEVLGMRDTSEIKANASLGVGTHGEKRGKKHLSKAERTETTATGGTIELDGQTHEVARTFLKSPVMLDLNGDGKLGVTGVSTAKHRIDEQIGRTVSFDIDGDGDLDRTEWMAGDGDGMLVDDRDGGATRAMGTDGRIDGTRLYGDQGGRYGNGYEKLAQHDANGDGVLTGAELGGLKTWIDDGDARLEAGELKSLADLGVTELDTRMTLRRNERGEALMQSSFVRDGERHLTEDVWFRTR